MDSCRPGRSGRQPFEQSLIGARFETHANEIKELHVQLSDSGVLILYGSRLTRVEVKLGKLDSRDVGRCARRWLPAPLVWP